MEMEEINTVTIIAASTLNPDAPSVTVKDDEWHSEFSTKDSGTSWSTIWD